MFCETPPCHPKKVSSLTVSNMTCHARTKRKVTTGAGGVPQPNKIHKNRIQVGSRWKSGC